MKLEYIHDGELLHEDVDAVALPTIRSTVCFVSRHKDTGVENAKMFIVFSIQRVLPDRNPEDGFETVTNMPSKEYYTILLLKPSEFAAAMKPIKKKINSELGFSENENVE